MKIIRYLGYSALLLSVPTFSLAHAVEQATLNSTRSCMPRTIDLLSQNLSDKSADALDCTPKLTTPNLADDYLQLAKSLEDAGLFDQALKALACAFPLAPPERRSEIQKHIVRVTVLQRESLHPGIVVSVSQWLLPPLGLILALSLVYLFLFVAGLVASRLSSRVDIVGFTDPTETGVGDSFRKTLQEVHSLVTRAQAKRPLTYHGIKSSMPILGSVSLARIPEVHLSVPGFQLPNILSQLRTLVLRPKYRIKGSVYDINGNIGLIVEIIRFDSRLNYWDFAIIERGDLRLAAYEVLHSLIRG